MDARSRIILLIASLAVAAMAAPALARDDDDDRCAGARDLTLINGKIHTLDARNSIVSSVTIRNGKFTAVGREAQSDDSRCMRAIDLRGRTAVPGLAANPTPFLLLALPPAPHTRLQ